MLRGDKQRGLGGSEQGLIPSRSDQGLMPAPEQGWMAEAEQGLMADPNQGVLPYGVSDGFGQVEG